MKRIQWVTVGCHVLKASEGGPGVTWAIKALRRDGIRAASNESPFVGHVGLVVAQGSVTQAKKVLRRLGWPGL